jgi:hypothetical protein
MASPNGKPTPGTSGIGEKVLGAYPSLTRFVQLIARHVRPKSRSVFGSLFDIWVPALLFTGIVAFVGTALKTPIGALATMAVFFLGLIPQAKMKRADLLVQLQERFSELAADKEALNPDDRKKAEASKVGASQEPSWRKEAYAFYLRFWYLQLLQFGLWRYGMLPSDTYAHWIVRRLISLRGDNTEQYWLTTPRQGWDDVCQEFLGTDFRYFIDAAIAIGREVEDEFRQFGDSTKWPDSVRTQAYDKLHVRIERLLVAAGAGGIWSTFIFRWFNARRPSLHDRQLVLETIQPLRRENQMWSGLFLTAAIAFVALCLFLGLKSQALAARLTGEQSSLVAVSTEPSRQGIVLDPDEGPVSTFVVRFPEEGSCTPGGNPRRWRGAYLTASSRIFVKDITETLAACSSPDRQVRVEVVGFASSSQFDRLSDCGPGIANPSQANVALANARASAVTEVLEQRLNKGEVTSRSWRAPADMESERGFIDRLVGGTYSRARGSLNRRVEIRILEPGECVGR